MARVWASAIIAAVATLETPFAAAQIDPTAKYDVVPIHPDYDTRMPEGIDARTDPEGYRAAVSKRTNATRRRGEAEKMIRDVLLGTVPLSQASEQFRFFFEQVVFAEMTQTDEASLQELPKRRERFLANYLQRKDVRQEPHDELLQITRRAMLGIATGNYHPAVRLNAILILGELNAEEPVLTGSQKRPPRPLPAALGDLVRLYRDANLPDSLRAAAMVGILRHASLDGQRREDERMELAIRYAIIDDMLKLIDQKEPPQVVLKPGAPPGQRSIEGHQWMRRRAIEILGALRDGGADDNVTKKLLTIINDKSEPLLTRCTAAEAFGQLNFLKPKEVDVAQAGQQIARLFLQAAQSEVSQLQSELQRRRLQAAIKAKVPVEQLAAQIKLEPYRLTASRRLLKYYFQSALKSLGEDEKSGLRRYAAEEPAKTLLTNLADAFQQLLKSTEKTRDERDLPWSVDMIVTKMSGRLNQLEKTLATVAAGAAPSADVPPAGPAPTAPAPGPAPPGPATPSPPAPGPAAPAPGPAAPAPAAPGPPGPAPAAPGPAPAAPGAPPPAPAPAAP